jgi:dTDP-4-dehydrorhamnose 3,5-epimerase
LSTTPFSSIPYNRTMIIQETPLAGVYAIETDLKTDERGFFGRTWERDVAKTHGLVEQFDYSCVSGNTTKHTLRGMHFQELPHGEVKLVRCTKGAMFDVVIDLRPDSKTFKQWFGIELTEENHKALYIPAGCAHGFLTLAENTEVLYSIQGEFAPEAARGVRYNDKVFGITWPAEPSVISERDSSYPDFA